MTKKHKDSKVTSAAKTLGEKGGVIGGPARARVLTKAQRVAIAKKGAAARNKRKS